VNKRTGKFLKAKPLPKKCTRACRQYRAPEPVPAELITFYTESDIRKIEQELLGLQLSSTPFDALDPQDRGDLREFAELLDTSSIPGVYMIAGSITTMRPHIDRTGRKMAFFNLATETTEHDIAVFASAYEDYGVFLKQGTFGIAEVRRDGRGTQLTRFHPLDH
jgi:DNA polymerase III alpha subunit